MPAIRKPSTAQTETLERVLRDYEQSLAGTAEPAAVRARRARAAEQLRRHGWPSTRDERWRYTNLRAIERTALFRAPPPCPPETLAAELDTCGALPAVLPGFERRIFVDGRSVDGGAASHPDLERPWPAELPFAQLTEMFASEPATLQVRGEAAVELCFLTSERAAQAAVYPQLRVRLEPASRLTLIERHLGGPPAGALVCTAALIELGADSRLTHYRLQQCTEQVAFMDSLSADVAARAEYCVRHIAIGAGSARTSARVVLAGRESRLDWQGLAASSGEQALDCSLEVEHRAAGTRTDEVFRGIAEQRSRIGFIGQILIDAGAAQSEAHQSLRGLIEGPAAEVDLRPRLQIHTEQVAATHGASTGQLDEGLLFYLLSRGLERDAARALLKWAFLGDVLAQIRVPGLRQAAEQAAAGRLRDAPLPEALA